MTSIRFGPAGLGGVKQAIRSLQRYKQLGLSACEIAFTYSVYIKEKDATSIGKEAKKLDIKLSIHAPYWINLNSKEKRKIQESKKRILDSCKIGNLIGAYRVVFHPGYYGGMDKEKTYQNIKKQIQEINYEIKKHKWKIKIAPETTGKVNVFGSVDEIVKLVGETGCGFCIDFAHILAREKKVDYDKILKKFSKFGKNLHTHFSGIVYGKKGEKRHIFTKVDEAREMLKKLKTKVRGKNIAIINESPDPIGDSVKVLKLWKKI